MNKPLTLADLSQVYSGKDGRCCCGCSGTHYAAGEPGFDRMVKKVLALVNDPTNSADDNGDHVALVVGSRLYVAYRTEAAEATASQEA